MPYLSHSQCETWQQCPRRWALQKIEGAPQAPSEALILGDAVHQAIELDGQRIIDGMRCLTHDEMMGNFTDALGKRVCTDDPQHLLPTNAFAEMWAKGVAILRAYVEHLQPRYAPTAVEEKIGGDEGIPIPGAPGWKFTGRIDARVPHADGQHIVDFKTGKAWHEGDEHSKDQATAYLWADRQSTRWGIAERVTFCIFPVEPDGNGGYTCSPQFRTTTRTDAQLAAYGDHLAATARAITEAKRNDDFPVRLSPLCAWCGVRGSCPEGEEYLKRTGRPAVVPSVRRQSEAQP